MAGQTTYAVNKSAARAGMLAYMGMHNEIVSKLAETTAIPFGVAVGRGTDDDQCVLGGDGIFLGIAIEAQTIEAKNDAGDVEYPVKGDVNVLKTGYVWCPISDTGSPGDALNYVDATGVIGVGAAEAGETDIANATLESTVASGGDLGLVRLGS